MEFSGNQKNLGNQKNVRDFMGIQGILWEFKGFQGKKKFFDPSGHFLNFPH